MRTCLSALRRLRQPGARYRDVGNLDPTALQCTRLLRIIGLRSHDKQRSPIRSAELLRGFRGAPVSDTPAVAECMQRLSQLVTDFPSIRELDINPLIVYAQGDGAMAADARIILTEGEDR